MDKPNEQLSSHLSRSEIACKCGCGFDSVSSATVDLFERIRELCCKCKGKDVPIAVSSGCRCPKHNAAIGGLKNSQHVRGNALDLICPNGVSMDEFHGVCLACNPNGGVGFYRKRCFIHVDTRGQKARWGK